MNYAATGHRIIREREPLNLEFPFEELDSYLTPNHQFYIRGHFPIPEVDRQSFRLRVEGAVERTLTLSTADLEAMEQETRVATLECAGNSRIFLVPAAEGAQWQQGAVSTAEWMGVPLARVLEKAGLKADALQVIFEGADVGKPKEKPIPPEPMPYARAIELDKVPDVLLALRMNGEPLPLENGAPVRAIVGGFYGMASVKWLCSIRVVTEPFQGYFHTSDYAYWDDLDGNPVRRSLGPMALKSAISRPFFREQVPAGQPYVIRGAAWTGGAPLDRVEVSCDGGSSWNQAEFIDEATPHAWRRWQLSWTPESEGCCSLLARAIDTEGKCQATEHDKKFGTYVIDHSVKIEVEVVSALLV